MSENDIGDVTKKPVVSVPPPLAVAELKQVSIKKNVLNR